MMTGMPAVLASVSTVSQPLSVLGAYAIQLLTITLYAKNVPSTDVKAYKAVVIILLVVLSSSVIKDAFSKLFGKKKPALSAQKGGEVK